jgi:menaquinone-dependent protoporphyrinogen oxidase
MKVLIVYDTKHGATAEAAERIAQAVRDRKGEAKVLDLREKGAATIALGSFDAVALGGPFYMGAWSQRAKAFAVRREAELMGKTIGVFAVGSDADLGDKAAIAALPATLGAAIAASTYVGGRMEFAKLGAFERFIVKKVSGKAEDSSTLDLAKAEAFGAELAEKALSRAKAATK